MKRNTLIRIGILLFTAFLIAFLAKQTGFSLHQAMVAGIFCMTIFGVLLFWELRLSLVFFGAGIMLLTHAVDLENLIKFASLDVILFLIGMMILVGMLNEVGFFYWLIMRLIRIRNLTGGRLYLLLMSISAILSGLMGEVASVVIMTKIILDISDFFDIDPVPLVLSSVLATNIGSSGTVLGNPIGILIAARGNLTFEDFIRQALPITSFVFILTVGFLFFWFRKYISQLTEKLVALRYNDFFFALINIPTDRKTKVSIGIFTLTLVSIAMHRRLELLFNLEENTLLMILPIVWAGIAMLYRRDKVRYYVEHEIEWPSILFFLFLFALAGVIQYSGISDILAERIISRLGTSTRLLSGIFLYLGGLLSSVLDNTVVVASCIPVIQSLEASGINLRPLWWAVLFGACYGGNITIIGSTANIVAMDILEKKRNIKVSFWEWFKIGIVVGMVSMSISYLFILLIVR